MSARRASRPRRSAATNADAVGSDIFPIGASPNRPPRTRRNHWSTSNPTPPAYSLNLRTPTRPTRAAPSPANRRPAAPPADDREQARAQDDERQGRVGGHRDIVRAEAEEDGMSRGPAREGRDAAAAGWPVGRRRGWTRKDDAEASGTAMLPRTPALPAPGSAAVGSPRPRRDFPGKGADPQGRRNFPGKQTTSGQPHLSGKSLCGSGSPAPRSSSPHFALPREAERRPPVGPFPGKWARTSVDYGPAPHQWAPSRGSLTEATSRWLTRGRPLPREVGRGVGGPLPREVSPKPRSRWLTRGSVTSPGSEKGVRRSRLPIVNEGRSFPGKWTGRGVAVRRGRDTLPILPREVERRCPPSPSCS